MLDSLPRCILQFVCLVVREIVGANTMITLVVMTSKVWVAQSSGLEYLIHTDTHGRPGEQKVVQKPAKWWGLKQAYLYTAHIFTHLRVDQSTPHNIYICIYIYIYAYVCKHMIHTHTYIYIHIYLFPTQQENGSEPEIAFVGWWSRDMAQHATTIRWRITWTNPVNSWCLSLGWGSLLNTYN